MKFKKGDKVIIRDGSKIEDYVGMWARLLWRKEYVGKTCTVERGEKLLDGREGYLLKEVGFYWDGRGLKPAKPETIVIYRKEQEVHALDKTTGEKAVAKCSPKDEFDFRTGAKLAFDRLMGKLADKVPFHAGLAIWCSTKQEYDLLMEQLDKRGYVWNSFTKIPERNYWHSDGTRIFVRSDEKLAQYFAGNKQYRSIQAIYDYVDFPQVEFDDILYNGKVVCMDAGANQDLYAVGKIYEFKDGFLTADNGETFPTEPVHTFDEWQEWTSSKFVEIVE